MKKIFLSTALITFSIINCWAQLTHSSDFVRIILPNGVHKLSKLQADAIVPRFKLPGKVVKSQGPPNVYQMDNVTLGLYNVNVNPLYGDLIREKSYKDESHLFLQQYGNKTYKSVIRDFGENQALIINYNLDGIGHYWFFYRNNEKTLGQAGKMDYKTADHDKAEAFLNNVLNNIQFTK